MNSPTVSRVIPIQPVAAAMYQKQPRIQSRSVSGWFATWRWAMVWLTQGFFYGMPWLQWGGRQALLFNLETRRFYILGLVLYPQDLIYLAALLVLSALALFLCTAMAGRLWCGYACPQTVYTEVFMWIERRIEGDRSARLRLDKAPWGADKIVRRGAKHTAWLAAGLATGVTFVGYFVPMRALVPELATFTAAPSTLFWIAFYALATYGNAGFLREQMCKYICPYARFQSAMIDQDSLVIAYDAARGDPRGARTRKEAPAAQGLGDCVDCTLCVQVCPTGIDIRNGLQNECIACAACIDACDGVMDKLGYAKGLIRYATENGVANGWSRAQMLRRAFRPRVLVYSAVLLLAGGAFAASIAGRSAFQFDVIKDRGALARVVAQGAVENVYRLQVMNRTERAVTYRIAAHGPDGLVLAAPDLTVEPTGIDSVIATARLPLAATAGLEGHSSPIVFDVTALAQCVPAGRVLHEKSTFYVPR